VTKHFDFQECAKYLGRYIDKPGYINICFVPKFGQFSAGRFFTTDLDGDGTLGGLADAIKYAEKLVAEEAKAVYLRVTTVHTVPTYGRAGAHDTLHIPWLWSDLDFGAWHKNPNLPHDEATAMRIVRRVEEWLGPCTILIHSGGGLYAEWMPHRELTPEKAEALCQNVQWAFAKASAEIGGWDYGTGVFNLDRVLRLPGTPNRKSHEIRMCRVVGGSGQPVNVDNWPSFAEPPAKPGQAPKVPLPEKKELDPNRKLGVLDIFAEQVEWSELLEAMEWSHVGADRTGELWDRPGGGDSEYSARILHAMPEVLVVHSESAGLPAGKGQRLTKGRVYAYHCYGGDVSGATKALIRGENPLGLGQALLDAIAEHVQGGVTVVHLRRDESPTPEQFMGGDRIMYVDEPATHSVDSADSAEIITDEDLDDYLATFTSHSEPNALVNREMWARNDGPGRLPLHAARFVHESILGLYPAALAAAVLADACTLYGVDPKATLKAALAAVLTSAVSA
jgi:hypothetical protein